MHSSYNVIGLPIRITNIGDLISAVDEAIFSGKGGVFVGVYASLARQLKFDAKYCEQLKRSFLYVDGKGFEWALRLLYQVGNAERMATTDVWPDILQVARQRGREIFLIGAEAAIIEKARRVMEGTGVSIEAYTDGFGDGLLPGSEIRAKIRESDSPVVLIGLGSGRQEEIAFEILEEADAGRPVVFTVGGLFDHIAGGTRRAPKFVQNNGLEWAWRVVQEPRRLFVRYFFGNALFILEVGRQYWRFKP
jgi:N-acetylglucosaminyldiphosphoundecaprenol N-acetyl-beta-D-mannosaminyltransferase